MNFLQAMADKALSDSYLVELMDKLEKSNAYQFLRINNIELINNNEFYDLLKFADILCRSTSPKGRNIAYRIIAGLYNQYYATFEYKQYASAVLTKLGNFPSLKLATGGKQIFDSLELVAERETKKVFQESLIKGKVFTDAQYNVYNAMINNNHFSFSGPTSFGKSFIMSAFIKYIIMERGGKDNIVILVPTRALINQVVTKLKEEVIKNNYIILAHPTVPYLYRHMGMNFIYVFTPERWVSYLAEKDNPPVTYMFIDEAQKIISTNDARAPLYYHAVLLAQRKSVNLFFASPNIPNVQIFLRLFNKSEDESMRIEDISVSQSRFFLDYINEHTYMFLESGKRFELPNIAKKEDKYFFKLLIRLGRGHKNIIYCNSVTDTIKYALGFSKNLDDKTSPQLSEAISLVKKHIHKDYYLLDCLKKGVAFHFGRLPQRIRECVEQLFSNQEIDYIFCTSTLLEGVNLPAKNIFIMNNAIGTSKFSDIDFWNLAGRAGRLSKELSGNVICVRIESNKWKNSDNAMEIIRNRNIKPVEPSIISGRGQFYKNIGNSLERKPFTNNIQSQTQRDIWNHYANILLSQQIQKESSLLYDSFLQKNHEGTSILKMVAQRNHVPPRILEQCSTIKAYYQNNVFDSIMLGDAFPDLVDYDSCLVVLQFLYEKYDWADEESKGTHPLVKDKSRLQYWASLMSNWISEIPLNQIINNILKYYIGKKIFYNQKMIDFDPSSREHINHVINNLISDIDNGLRFKIKSYVMNYYLLIEEKLGKDNAGHNWAEYLEYGTSNMKTIELQNIGIPRHLATTLLDDFNDCLNFSGQQLIGIDWHRMLSLASTEEYYDFRNEISKLLPYNDSLQ